MTAPPMLPATESMGLQGLQVKRLPVQQQDQAAPTSHRDQLARKQAEWEAQQEQRRLTREQEAHSCPVTRRRKRDVFLGWFKKSPKPVRPSVPVQIPTEYQSVGHRGVVVAGKRVPYCRAMHHARQQHFGSLGEVPEEAAVVQFAPAMTPFVKEEEEKRAAERLDEQRQVQQTLRFFRV